MAFHFFEDFRNRDEKNHSYRIDIENHSSYSHGHAQIFEEGEYRITLNGNKHFLSTPDLKDFHLEMNFSLRFRNIEFGYGFIWYFRYDRNIMAGHTLEMKFDNKHKMRILLDGKSLGEKVFDSLPSPENMDAVLDVKGQELSFTVFGNTYTGKITKKNLPGKGSVGFDMLFAPGSTAHIHKVELFSTDSCTVDKFSKTFSFILSTIQGMTEPLKFQVSITPCGNNCVQLDCIMDGTIRGREDRDDGGTRGWIYEYDTVTSPYIRIESEGKEVLNIYFRNGKMVILDKDWKSYANRKLDDLAWPMQLSLFLRDFPEKYIVAAGYENVKHKPWLFCENGPWEQIQDQEGNLIYEGPSLRKDSVGLLVKSPENKKIVSRIPENIPMYDEAVKHAKEQHYFYDDEKISFLLQTYYRKECYCNEEFILSCEVQDPYGKAVPGVKVKLANTSLSVKEDSFACIGKKVTLNKHLPCGIYHLKLVLKNGLKTFFDDVEVFEVLPEDPDGLPPPLASGLPVMLSMNNEIKNLQSDAFDPLGGWGGMGHYYTLVMRYPYIGAKLKIWELLKVYHRKWHLMLTRRNCGDFSLENETNRELIRHADFLDKDVPEWESKNGSIFLYRRDCHCGPLLRLLKEFLIKNKITLRLTTPALIDKMLSDDPPHLPAEFCKRNHLSKEQFDELVNTCWNQWVDYAGKALKKRATEFWQEIMKINPAIGRGSYGPSSLYVQNYKSAYGSRLAVRSYEYDEESNKNGSYFFIEEYHLSCDYTIVRSSYFIANCKLMRPGMRKLFPEIYYGGGLGCNDGAVYQAHPPFGIYDCLPSHQRSIVYTFCYATPYFKNGKFDYWRDHGFHCPTPDKKSFREFINAWGNMLRNPPAKQLAAPFFCYDFKLFELLGDYHEDKCNYEPAPGIIEGWTDVVNTGEEAMGYAFIELAHNGCNTPVQTTFEELPFLTKEQAPFIVLPPIPERTPKTILQKIRAAHKKGINLLAFEKVCGLEDLFGVKEMEEKRPLRRIGKEVFQHKKALAAYENSNAVILKSGSETFDGKEDIAVLFCKETKWGRTCLFNVPPCSVKREDYRQKLGCGQATISNEMHDCMMKAYSFLMPEKANYSELGMLNVCLSEKGDVIATICGCTPAYGVTDKYPRSFRFKVSYPGIGKAEIETDAPCTVIKKEKDSLFIRTETELDAGLFFRFIMK
ncbi:MAG: hypothetical protein J6S53_01720 [Lentisphaeria bacterium]|nr:hypothetical protein [Lentisphaeria bacterium]